MIGDLAAVIETKHFFVDSQYFRGLSMVNFFVKLVLSPIVNVF